MAKSVSAVRARVSFVTKEKEGNYGPYKSALFLDQSAPDRDAPEDLKYWVSYNPEQYDQIPPKGSVHTLVQTPKGGWMILDDGSGNGGNGGNGTPAVNGSNLRPAASSQPAPVDYERRKEESKALIRRMVKLYRFCYTEVEREFAQEIGEGKVDGDGVRSIATGLFIEAKNAYPPAEIFRQDIQLQVEALLDSRKNSESN